MYLFDRCIYEKYDYVLILESDVIFEGNLVEYLKSLENFINTNKPHCLSIGSGCDLIDDDVNTEDMSLQIFKKKLVRCMDSYIFSYEGICLFRNYIKSYGIIDEPIDNLFELFINSCDYNLYWVWPSITLQGSQYGHYKSSIQNQHMFPKYDK